MSRFWALGAAVERQEALRAGMIAASGMPKEALEGARRVTQTQHMHREPTEQNGFASPAVVNGETFQLTESHVNADGETVLSGYRRNGPQFEKVRIVQAQASEHTRIVSRVIGDR
jgi:hypothetical protein